MVGKSEGHDTIHCATLANNKRPAFVGGPGFQAVGERLMRRLNRGNQCAPATVDSGPGQVGHTPDFYPIETTLREG